MGWSALDNGSLLRASEATFDVLVTTDKNLRYQQNLTGRRLAIVVLHEPTWVTVRVHAEAIRLAIESLKPGEYREMTW